MPAAPPCQRRHHASGDDHAASQFQRVAAGVPATRHRDPAAGFGRFTRPVLAMIRRFWLSERLTSVRYALSGIAALVRSQPNSRVHAAATAVVVLVSFWYRLSAVEWCLIVMAVSSVWTAEALNTAIEFLADAVSPEFHPLVRQCKDVAAGAVLLAAVGAAAVGLIILGPHLVRSLSVLPD